MSEMIEVYTRHASGCSKDNKRDWKTCKCPKWLYDPRTRRRWSARTRSWEKQLGLLGLRVSGNSDPVPLPGPNSLCHAVGRRPALGLHSAHQGQPVARNNWNRYSRQSTTSIRKPARTGTVGQKDDTIVVNLMCQ